MSQFVASRLFSDLPPARRVLQSKQFSVCMATTLSLSLIMSLSGAFDTDDLVFGHRIALWLTVCGLIAAQVVALEHTMRRFAGGLPRPHTIAGGAALVFTVLLLAVELHGLKFTPLLPKEPDPPLEFLLFVAPPVAVIGGFVLLLINGVRLLEHPKRTVEQTATRAETASGELTGHTAPPAVADELSGWPVARILRVTVDDHYLEVVTDAGTSLIRGRMKDAIARLEGADGLQVHRSHWVAAGQIVRLYRRGRDYSIRLKDELIIPVSRSRLRELKALNIDRNDR